MRRRIEARLWASGALAPVLVIIVVLGAALVSPVRGAVLSPAVQGALAERPRTAIAATFGTGSAEATFGEEVVFRQPVTVEGEVLRAEALLEYPGGIGPVVTEILPPGPAGEAVLEYRLIIAEGHLLPNTTLTGRFRLTATDGTTTTGPPLAVRYEDTRYDWQTESGDVVRVHWYEGSDAFGRRALAIAEEGMAEAEAFLGVTETDPVDFFVYADRDAFYDAMGPGLRENVGGLAESEIRTLFALITPGEIDDQWVGIVIPHELSHLVFDTAADNPYHLWPKWLDEGVATYLSQGYTASDRRSVESAADDGTLIPLDGLTGQFPTVRERFFLAYAESVSAVDFLVRQHGTEALSGLINSFALGLSDDEAFESAIGQTTEEFNAAWFADLGVELPTAHGPQPAPIGPLPPDWEGSPVPGASGSPSPSAGPSATQGTDRPPGGDDTESSAAIVLVAGLGLAGAAVAAGLLMARRARSRSGARPAATSTAGPPASDSSASGAPPSDPPPSEPASS